MLQQSTRTHTHINTHGHTYILQAGIDHVVTAIGDAVCKGSWLIVRDLRLNSASVTAVLTSLEGVGKTGTGVCVCDPETPCLHELSGVLLFYIHACTDIFPLSGASGSFVHEHCRVFFFVSDIQSVSRDFARHCVKVNVYSNMSFLHLCIHTSICAHVCVCVCVCARARVCTVSFIRMCAHTHVWLYENL
jgi:hypothetical protein